MAIYSKPVKEITVTGANGETVNATDPLASSALAEFDSHRTMHIKTDDGLFLVPFHAVSEVDVSTTVTEVDRPDPYGCDDADDCKVIISTTVTTETDEYGNHHAQFMNDIPIADIPDTVTIVLNGVIYENVQNRSGLPSYKAYGSDPGWAEYPFSVGLEEGLGTLSVETAGEYTLILKDCSGGGKPEPEPEPEPEEVQKLYFDSSATGNFGNKSTFASIAEAYAFIDSHYDATTHSVNYFELWYTYNGNDTQQNVWWVSKLTDKYSLGTGNYDYHITANSFTREYVD